MYQDYLINIFGIPENAARFLIYQYGTMCLRVVQLGEECKLNEQVHPDFPFLKSQIAYSIDHEFVQKPTDVLCRRLPIAFLDKKVSKDIFLPLIVEMMAKKYNWNKERQAKEIKEAL